MFAGPRAAETRMNLSHPAAAVNKDRRRECQHGAELRQDPRGVGLVRNAGNQRVVLDAVLGAERQRLFRRDGRVVEVFEQQGDDLQALLAVRLIERGEEARFVIAIRAPRSGKGDHDDLVAILVVVE